MDAGATVDAGPGLDAGARDDAGDSRDAGAAIDAGPPLDAGVADGGVADAGVDGGPDQDAGIVSVDLVVPNWSFEVGTPYGPADGWTSNNDAGSGGAHPGDEGFAAAADGLQFHFVNLPDFSGPNPSFTQSNPGLIGTTAPGRYTLTVAVGRRTNNATTDGTVLIELLSDDVVIGSTIVINPFSLFASGSWNDVVASAVVEPGQPTVGGDLRIRLSATDGTGGIRSQAQFDAVRLHYASP